MPEPNAFTGAALDRAEDGRRRIDGWVEEQRADPRSRVLLAADQGLRAEEGSLVLAPLAEAEDAAAGGAVLLGLDAGGPLWALDRGPSPADGERPVLIGAGGRRGEPLDETPGWLGLREAAGTLSQAEGGLAAYAAALLNWHRSHGHCANCGAATDPIEGGAARRCPRCGANHHPRTDPVVIMLVVDGDRVVLGRQASWPAQRYSALAGFVSPGENLEEAVAREVREEAGVEVGAPRYMSSQPWPFPSSLMLGFLVPWESGEVGGSDPELQDVRWFTRDEVAEAAERNERWDVDGIGGTLQLPAARGDRQAAGRALAGGLRRGRGGRATRRVPGEAILRRHPRTAGR